MTEVRQSSAANAIGTGQGPKVSGLVGTGGQGAKLPENIGPYSHIAFCAILGYLCKDSKKLISRN